MVLTVSQHTSIDFKLQVAGTDSIVTVTESAPTLDTGSAAIGTTVTGQYTRDIPLFGYGSTTFRKEEKAAGLEPDECYCRGGDREIPDIALEVVVTHGAIDKLEAYRGLGVREVWVFEKGVFRVLALHGETYEAVAASEILPEVDLAQIARYASQPDQHAALRAFRADLRG